MADKGFYKRKLGLEFKEINRKTWTLVYKDKAIIYRSRGFQDVQTQRFRDIRRMKVARLSALCTGRL